jgi:hypothetical protein
MKLKNIPIVFAITIFAVTWISCKKENKCTGGSGGNLYFVATLMHHTKHIYGLPNYRDTVYVKYNSQDKPSNGLAGFDAKFIGDVGKDYVVITGLQCGDYYFYGAGRDTTIDTLTYPHVVGGYPYSTTQTSGLIPITIAVTEGD